MNGRRFWRKRTARGVCHSWFIPLFSDCWDSAAGNRTFYDSLFFDGGMAQRRRTRVARRMIPA
ncbi:hypothetical protein EMIT0P201_12101 [Pseudomonas chlororaphis]